MLVPLCNFFFKVSLNKCETIFTVCVQLHDFEIPVVYATVYKLLFLVWCVSFVYAHFSYYMGVIFQFSIEWENADDCPVAVKIKISRSTNSRFMH